MSQIDIIYVNYNSTDCMIRSIESIYESIDGLQARIIVVDNASGDHPVRLKFYFPEVILILNKKNYGFSKAMNQALSICNAMYIVILNPDTLITKSFFIDTLSWLKNHQSAGIVAPRVYDSDGKIQGSARKFPSLLTSLFGRKSPLTRIFPNNQITKKEFVCFSCSDKQPISVDWVSGACMVVKRKAIEDVGGFDERFFLYWEDTDLCKRMKDKGWKVVYLPMARVTHFVGQSSSKKPLFSIFHFHRSCYYLFKKHSKWPLSLLTPLAFAGLAARTIFVMGLHFAIMICETNHRKNSNRLTDCKKVIETDHKKKALKILTKNTQTKFEHRDNTNWDIKDFELIDWRTEGSIITDLKLCFKLLKIIREFKPNLIQTESTKPGIIGRVYVLFYNSTHKNKIKTVHIPEKEIFVDEFRCNRNFVTKSIEKLLSKKTDIIVAASETQRWEMGCKYKIAEPAKIRIINPGINLSNFNHSEQVRNEIRSKFNIDRNTIIIGSVGNLIPRKNHWLLFKAAENIISNSKNSSVKFILFGEGELKDSLMRYGAQNGLSKHIIFYGWERNLSKIYACIDVLAHTSNYEGMPIAVIEAMAAMVPVITTGVGGVKELLGKFKNTQTNPNGFKLCERGILCPKNDPVALANGIQYLVYNCFRTDTDLLIKAKEFVAQNYSYFKMKKDTESLYDELLMN